MLETGLNSTYSFQVRMAEQFSNVVTEKFQKFGKNATSRILSIDGCIIASVRAKSPFEITNQGLGLERGAGGLKDLGRRRFVRRNRCARRKDVFERDLLVNFVFSNFRDGTLLCE